MSPINSRSKGKRAELQLCRILSETWPEAGRNLDQFGNQKMDVINTPGVHWQCKHVERLNIWAALDQAITESAATDLPVVAFKRNRSQWFGALDLSELVALLRMREL
jgi:hypothetical protein